MKILCIDDDLEDLELISEAIKTMGPAFTCIMTSNADDGLALLQSLHPGFVFLDINMPVIDGRVILKRIRKNRAFDQIKVCILSTSITPAESEIYSKMGANYCLRKPNSFDELKTSLRLVLEGLGEKGYLSIFP